MYPRYFPKVKAGKWVDVDVPEVELGGLTSHLLEVLFVLWYKLVQATTCQILQQIMHDNGYLL